MPGEAPVNAARDANAHKTTHRAVPKGAWTKEEDETVMRLVGLYGPTRWAAIASNLPGRNGKQCRERWHNQLDPSIKRDSWTEEEDRILMESHRELGSAWVEISKRLPGRTDNAIKNRWNSSMRKRYAATGSTSPGKRPAPTAYTAPSVAPPPSKKVKTDAAVGAGSAPRPAMAGVQGGAAGAGQAVSGRALSSDGKLGSGTTMTLSVVAPRSAPNSLRRRNLQDRHVETIGTMGSCSDHSSSTSRKHGAEEETSPDSRRPYNLSHLCDDRLSGDTMTIDETDLSHLSAEATLPLLDTTRSYGTHSPGLGGIAGASTSTPSNSHSTKMLLTADLIFSASRLGTDALSLLSSVKKERFECAMERRDGMPAGAGGGGGGLFSPSNFLMASPSDPAAPLASANGGASSRRSQGKRGGDGARAAALESPVPDLSVRRGILFSPSLSGSTQLPTMSGLLINSASKQPLH
eukprot:Tamp_09796.p1 GENE.Tamp_09796~~Tamp_09796.p1  ORF type:complete len:530 (+),score=70.26 Tamp_09796:200-1591(+)